MLIAKSKQKTEKIRLPILWLSVLLCCVLLLSSCSGAAPLASDVVPPSDASTPAADMVAAGAPVAMLTTETMADSSYGQLAFENLSRAAGEIGLTSGLYRTATADSSAVANALELAVKGGAELVVMLGEELSSGARQAVLLYPQVLFVMQDLQMQQPLPENVVQIEYSNLQTGFLAGYAGVYQHTSDVGVLYVPEDRETTEYALGFLLGADAAAGTQYLQEGDLEAWTLPFTPAEQELFSPIDRGEIDASEVLAEGEEVAVQRNIADFFEQTDSMSLVFASKSDWIQPALDVAVGDEGRVALPLVGELPLSHKAAAIQIQFNTQRILAQLLFDWQQGFFPSGDVITGTLAEGDMSLYMPDDTTGQAEAICESVEQMFTSPAEYPQATVCLELEEATLPEPEELELEHYSVHTQGPFAFQADVATSSSSET